jgi:hypothetical protein
MTFFRLLKRNRWAQAMALGGALILLLFTLDRCARHSMSALSRSATQAGRAEQRSGDLQKTITRTERANDAAETIRRDPDARYAECLHHARNPGDC